jgi:hypothetical protein
MALKLKKKSYLTKNLQYKDFVINSFQAQWKNFEWVQISNFKAGTWTGI